MLSAIILISLRENLSEMLKFQGQVLERSGSYKYVFTVMHYNVPLLLKIRQDLGFYVKKKFSDHQNDKLIRDKSWLERSFSGRLSQSSFLTKLHCWSQAKNIF